MIFLHYPTAHGRDGGQRADLSLRKFAARPREKLNWKIRTKSESTVWPDPCYKMNTDLLG
jgi:hypothetical protein